MVQMIPAQITQAMKFATDSSVCDVQHAVVATFVSTVPVALDTAFKWWLFKGLNRIDPSASVTLSEIDRH